MLHKKKDAARNCSIFFLYSIDDFFGKYFLQVITNRIIASAVARSSVTGCANASSLAESVVALMINKIGKYKSPCRLIDKIREGSAAPVDWIALINTNNCPRIGPDKM